MLQSIITMFFESIFKETDNGNIPFLFIVILSILAILISIIPKIHTFLSYDSFDIYLMHKRRHSPIQLTKIITSFLIGTILFLATYLLLGFVLSKWQLILIIFLIISTLILVLFIFYMLIYVILNFFKFKFYTNRKIKFEIFTYILLVLSISLLGIIGSSILFTSFELINNSGNFTFEVVSNEITTSSNVNNLSIFEVSIILLATSVFPTYILLFMKPHKKDVYELDAIFENQLPGDFKLHLDYVIDNETTVLFNSENNIKAIKRNFENNYIVEIYKKKTNN